MDGELFTYELYIHKKFNLVEDGFFIEMKVIGGNVDIIENDKENETMIFKRNFKN
jgi:hypothetical protein